ncbi:MAG: hypothetical protein KAS17_11235 [Victivallaceae bacterium]|nr:hypothetical protein [Victivallaceae bacterium]
MNAYVINTGSGGGISCDNGATASAPNSLANVQVFNGTIAAGSAVTFLGALYTAAVPTGTALVNLGHGTISTAEIGCLSGVTSPIQAQLDAKTNPKHQPQPWNDTDRGNFAGYCQWGRSVRFACRSDDIGLRRNLRACRRAKFQPAA